ncbi:TonB-dependent receptor domain-containing protein [Hufsiella ginkgonis]|uniref:TonB-dependent receptor n=1 Tax=Hufsiella ginkgonis TaxID=2695274 RepID=A0A7K1XSP8_9SPHI|nr:TonB-dependent receptor [Hufsiella ginkgonis]MXV14025.1 TonB-dependent receptor [Hufsiella ginkgonis]
MKPAFALFFILFTFALKAQVKPVQGRGKISGHVIDSLTRQPVDYASVLLYENGAARPVNGITTDPRGNFNMTGLPDGEYRLTIDFIGYKRTTVQPVILNEQNRTVNLNALTLTPSQTELSAVAITGRPPIIENKIDKMVYNAQNDISGQAGMATDILKKVPMVTVDIDGNVELQGNSSIRFLINGKPSSLFGSSIANALQTIPASQIKSIEVITSPGAKYDASGTGGIINIILKSNNVRGINGNINASAGTRLENGSASLNIKGQKLSIGANLGGNAQLNTTTVNGVDRSSRLADTLNDLAQHGISDVNRKGYRAGLNFDWSMDKKNDLTASLGYNRSKNASSNQTDQLIRVQKGSTLLSNSASLLKSDNHAIEQGLDLGLEYKHAFAKEDQEISFQVNADLGKATSFYNQVQQDNAVAPAFAGSTSTSPGRDNEAELALDYVHPVSDNLTIETGLKTVINDIHSTAAVYSLNKTTGTYVFSPSQSNGLDYKRYVYSAYLSGSYQLYKFLDVKTGLRYERTTSKASYSQVGKADIKPYNTFAPSAVVSHTFKNEATVKISYSYRIERPDYEDLNPFIDLSDPRNISAGNPALQPEIGNNFELSYNKSFDKGANIFVSAFWRKNTSDIKGVSTFYSNYTIGDSVYQNVTFTTRRNIGEEIREGVNLSGSLPAGNKLTLRTNIMLANQAIINRYTGGPNVTGFGYRVNLNSAYQVNSDLVAELFGNYNSSQKNIQGNRPAFFSYNMALRKQFAAKKGSIGLSATNPFNKYNNQTTTVTTGNSTRISFREVPYRSFGVVLSYRFGKLDFKKDEQSNLPAPIE